MSAGASEYVPPEVKAAVRSFLEECQKEARPFDTTQALKAIRRIFPGLDIADSALLGVLNGEAFSSGFQTHLRTAGGGNQNETLQSPKLVETQRSVDSDKSGARRRSKETKSRNYLL